MYWKSDNGYFLKVDVQYTEELHELHNDLPFLSERMNVEKLVANLYDKNKWNMHKKSKTGIKS